MTRGNFSLGADDTPQPARRATAVIICRVYPENAVARDEYRRGHNPEKEQGGQAAAFSSQFIRLLKNVARRPGC